MCFEIREAIEIQGIQGNRKVSDIAIRDMGNGSGGQGVVSSSLATRTTEKACNRNGYRLSSYLFSMGFPFSFPFTASEKRIYACSDGKVSAKKMSGEGHSPDTFSINFSILAALFCFIWSVTCP